MKSKIFGLDYPVTILTLEDTLAQASSVEVLHASLDASPDSGQALTEFIFDASGSTSPNPINLYAFYFGDGTTYAENPTHPLDGSFDGITTHIYISPGDYNPKVVVINESGERDSAFASITISHPDSELVELSNDDGTSELTFSWINYSSNDGPQIIYNESQNSWGYIVFGTAPPVSNPVEDRRFGFSSLFSPLSDFRLEKVKIYFQEPIELGSGFYLDVWDSNGIPLLPEQVFISSNEVTSAGWWEKDISNYNILISGGERLEVGICQHYLPYFNIYSTPPWPIRPVFLGFDNSSGGSSRLLKRGNFIEYNAGNFMIRAKGMIYNNR